MTKSFSDASVHNPQSPFNILNLDDRSIQPNQMLEYSSLDKITGPKKEKLEAFWQDFMLHHKLSQMTQDTLILPGQPGMALALVFYHVMCEAFSFSKKLESFSKKLESFSIQDQAVYSHGLNQVYKRHTMLLNSHKKIIPYPIPTICFKKTILLLVDPVSAKTVNNIEESPSSGTSFFLDNCFDEKIETIIRNYIESIKKSNSICSRMLTHDLHFSFDYIDTATGNVKEKIEVMENLIQSGKSYRSQLNLILRNHKESSSSDFNKEIARLEANKKKNDELEINDKQKNKKKPNLLQRVLLSPFSKRKHAKGVLNEKAKTEDNAKTDFLNEKKDAYTKSDITRFGSSSSDSSEISSKTGNLISESVPKEITEVSQPSNSQESKRLFQRKRNFVGKPNKPKNHNSVLNSLTKDSHKSTFYYDLNSTLPDNSKL
ncbi:uncharacterized protein LOC128882513 [Hylaeus volcanicus]|uniref:uncharacterized protein LOC128882513 n=1 Tax=Hylaeus volcanicus TaxID=313075 RepID=UPI0023B85C0B|nr:uncharacterized protein LOC128882513 [Hylaeus volcanicus]XP_053990097.1 uncharacterized protein LOC128882513 [Hylaeus volcanicus]XP_053990098.1 uncharacterized protein LOC128882513 [Hylaeus volcanicus]